jgi:HEAT repeat protein
VRAILAVLALLTGAAAAEPQAAPPAAESTALIDALESSPLAVAGTIEGRTALDARSWRAALRVESVLGGEPPQGPVTIAWEELASARPPRFANGDRVLLALEPLQAGSLWRERFGGPKALLAVRGLAQRGTAFLRNPSLGSLSLLHHYLALPADLREGAAGRRHLIALAADGERALAISAARRLARPAGAISLGEAEVQAALRALARADAEPELAAPLLSWVERRQPAGLAPALDAALADPARAPASFVLARGLLGEGLPAEREALLLASPSAGQRAAAARVAGPAQASRLADLLRNDPAPEVRVAALQRLARLEGASSLDALLDAFDDEDAAVRRAAGDQAAAFGPEAVPRLADVAERWPWPAPQTAVEALRLANAPEAHDVLVRLADEHPDRRVRMLAALALGRDISRHHH